jgi:glycosyltransferase involved in cell wall biosynthesis
MKLTATQGQPSNDPEVRKHYEEMGKKKAEQRLAQRKAEKETECKDNACKVVMPDLEAMGTIPATTKRDNWPDQTTKDPKVTLAMIVKNEGKVLRRCLESVAPYVDDMVVVDTGSTDNTMDIARGFGAKVFEHPWEDSFSVARNWAIYHTDTQWLLQLDADEELDKDSGPKIRDAVRQAHNTTTNLIHMVLINIDEAKGEQQSIINTGKLMRVVPTLHFKNRVHNKLICPGDTILTTLKIYHYGYALPNQDGKEYMNIKKSRTTRLLHIQAEEQPDDPETFYYLAIQYLRMDDFDTAIEHAKKAIGLFEKYEPESQLVLLAHHIVAVADYHKQVRAKSFDFSEAIRYSEKALVIYPDYVDSNSLLSSIYFALKDYDNCLKYSEKFLAACEMLRKDPSKSLVIPLNTLKNEWMVYLQLAINFFEQADSEKAIYLLSKSEDLLSPENKYKPSWGVFKYLITRGDTVSLKRAEAIYRSGFRADGNPVDEKNLTQINKNE